MSSRKTKVKSTKKLRGVTKLGWSETSKNINTLRKIEKACFEETYQPNPTSSEVLVIIKEEIGL
jgi:hypothetical protein